MKITTTEGKGGRLNIFADGEFAFSLDAVIWYGCGICDGDDVDEEVLADLKRESLNRHALSSALNILTRRAHSEKELRFKLKQKFDAEAVDFAIEKAAEMGFIDDDDFAEMYARELANSKKFAPGRIVSELVFKGVDKNIAQNVVDDLEIDIFENIEYILDNKYPNFDDDDKKLRRAINGLQRYGYSFYDIKYVINKKM